MTRPVTDSPRVDQPGGSNRTRMEDVKKSQKILSYHAVAVTSQWPGIHRHGVSLDVKSVETVKKGRVQPNIY